MRRFSHILSFLTVALFILAVANPANADPTDPGIIIQTASTNPGTNFISGTSFSFTTTTGSDCVFPGNPNPNDCALSNTGVATWTAISFDISPSIQTGTFSCSGGPYFTNPCSIVADSDGDLVATLSGGPGIPVNNFPDAVISIFGWASGTTFDATITAPEPGTLALLLTGGGFLLARRRRQNTSHA